MNSMYETYIDIMKRYVIAWERGDDDLALSFLKEDVDYYWNLLSEDERHLAYKTIVKFNSDITNLRKIEAATED